MSESSSSSTSSASLTQYTPSTTPSWFDASMLHDFNISLSHVTGPSRSPEFILNASLVAFGQGSRYYVSKSYSSLRRFRRAILRAIATTARRDGRCTCQGSACAFAGVGDAYLRPHALTCLDVLGFGVYGSSERRQDEVRAFVAAVVATMQGVDKARWSDQCLFLQLIAYFFDTAAQTSCKSLKMARSQRMNLSLHGWHLNRTQTYGAGITSAKSALTKGKETISRISKINDTADIVDGLSSIGLNQLHVFPEPLRQRVSTLLKERTQVQLEKLKETITLGTSKSRFPWDSHNEQIGWEMDKKAKIPEFLYGPQETMAYMAFEMDGVYSSVHHVLRQMTDADGEATPFQPKSMLDFGSGPGTASWVAKEFFDESLQEYRLVEPSQSMADAANVIMEGFRGLSFRKSLGEMKREIAKGKQYDLIMASFVLSDITNDIERIAIVSTLWSLLAENGRLVLVDRGTHDHLLLPSNSWGSLQVRSARQFILDSLTTNADEVVVSDDATPRIQGGKVLGRAIREVYRAARKAHWGAQWPASKDSYELPKAVHPPKRRKRKPSAKKLAARAGKLVQDS
ncbi:hypothetical protein DYB28_001209 [Aphanomyces astaci]|uniref:Methyltransferase domain-containing protein n=1 Tax=Aphanomyces astaci TaxID=112090 RepID=A0A9X8HC72_APHAT|nr:hypothetical protein DYB28_001209 [Aphanomyces astaci]